MIDGEMFWDPMVKDALLKLEMGITDEHEIYRVFRSEIDYLSEDYAGVQELAQRVKDVAKGEKESIVDRKNTIAPSSSDDEKLVLVNAMERELSKHSIGSSEVKDDLDEDVFEIDMKRYDYEDE